MSKQLPKPMSPVSDNKEQRKRIRAYAQIIEEFYESHNNPMKAVDLQIDSHGIRFGLRLLVGISLDDVLKYQKSLAVVLGAPNHKITIDAPIPGTALVGITIPWIYPEPEPIHRPISDPYIRRVIGVRLMKISAFFFRLSEKIGGPAICRTGG